MTFQLSRFTNCKKQRDDPDHHSKFIAVEDFSIDMLPKNCKKDERIPCLLGHIKKLTVKIDVKKKSSKDNKNKLQSGSGIIVNVHNNDVSQVIKILTAKHVLGDTFQAQHSKAIVGFDKYRREWYSTNGIQIEECNYEKDWCFFYSKIEKGIKYFDEIEKDAQELKKALVLRERYTHLRDKDKLCLMISHPHGCHKHVSFGTLVGFDELHYDHEEIEKYDRLIYNTPTCNGCSGAFILALGTDDIQVHSRRKTFDEGTFNLSSGPIQTEKIQI